jgi:hypothetical protein
MNKQLMEEEIKFEVLQDMTKEELIKIINGYDNYGGGVDE